MDVYRCMNCDFKDQLDERGCCKSCGSSAVVFLCTLPNHGKSTQDILDIMNNLFTKPELWDALELVHGKVGQA